MGSKIVIVLVVIGAGVLGFMRASNRAAVSDFEASTKVFIAKAQELLQRQNAGEDVTHEQMKMFDDFLAEAEKTGNKIGGREAKAMRALVLAMRDIQPVMKKHDEALKAVTALGGASPEGIKKKEDVEPRLAAFAKLNEANDALDNAFKGVPAAVRMKAAEVGLSESETNEFLTAIGSSGNVEMTSQVRQCDREAIAEIVGQLKMLGDHFGKWKQTGDQVDFQDDALNAQFNKYYEKMNAAIERQERIQQQALDKARTRMNR